MDACEPPSPREQLREARKHLGLTQAQLAERLGENSVWVSRRETGEARLTHEDVDRLAVALSLTNEDILRLHGREPETAA